MANDATTEGPLRVRNRSTFVVRYDALLTVIVAFAVGICIGMAVQYQIDHSLPPCLTEDSDNCYWDSATHGNGQGRSFYVIDGQVTYTGEQ